MKNEILNRVNDAIFLWNNEKKESAFLLVLTGVASAARHRYPDIKGDRIVFENFLKSCHSVRLSVEFRGECVPMETILYKWVRCELVHEGGLPVDIVFMDELKKESMSVRAGGEPDYILKIGEGWFWYLVNSTKKYVDSLK